MLWPSCGWMNWRGCKGFCGFSHPRAGWSLLGPPRPQTPGHFFPDEKVTKTPPGDPDPFSVQSVWIRFAAAVPLNHRILRASDLHRVSRPTSAVALLKGEIHLFSVMGCLRLLKTGLLPTTKICQIPHPEGRQAKSDAHRTDYEEASGLAEIQWLPGVKSDGVRLGK